MVRVGVRVIVRVRVRVRVASGPITPATISSQAWVLLTLRRSGWIVS